MFIKVSDRVQFSDTKLNKVMLAESPRLLFDVYCLQPGQSQKVHVHEGVDKVYVVLSGRPTVQLGDESRTLERDEAAYAPASVPHGVRNDTTEPATLLVFQARTPVL